MCLTSPAGSAAHIAIFATTISQLHFCQYHNYEEVSIGGADKDLELGQTLATEIPNYYIFVGGPLRRYQVTGALRGYLVCGRPCCERRNNSQFLHQSHKVCHEITRSGMKPSLLLQVTLMSQLGYLSTPAQERAAGASRVWMFIYKLILGSLGQATASRR